MASSVFAGKDGWFSSDTGLVTLRLFKPHFEVAFGADYRTDEYQNIDPSFSLHARLYYFVTESMAFTTGFGYNPVTRFDPSHFVSTISYTLGIRCQDNSGVVSPYFESGGVVLRYIGKEGYSHVVDTKAGLSFALGMAIKLSRAVSVDVALKQVLDRLDNHDTFILEESNRFTMPPYGEDTYFRPTREFSSALFNPTTIELLIRAKL
jgi:hypothetical protein